MPSELIGASPRLRAVLDQIGIISSVDSAVLLQGETGTGKELEGLPVFVAWRSSIGGRARRLQRLPITLTQAQHFSVRSSLDRNRALWGGFVLIADGARIYFAGDTA
jgi:hypothetical protein